MADTGYLGCYFKFLFIRYLRRKCWFHVCTLPPSPSPSNLFASLNCEWQDVSIRGPELDFNRSSWGIVPRNVIYSLLVSLTLDLNHLTRLPWKPLQEEQNRSKMVPFLATCTKGKKKKRKQWGRRDYRRTDLNKLDLHRKMAWAGAGGYYTERPPTLHNYINTAICHNCRAQSFLSGGWQINYS